MVLCCDDFANKIKKESKKYIDSLNGERRPTLCVIQVGDNPASNSYIRGKKKDCNEVGIEFVHHHIKDESVTQEQLIDVIESYNNREDVDGIIVQLPLPKHIDENVVCNCVTPSKDVDGFNKNSSFTPCTPKGILRILDECEVNLVGANCVMVGSGRVGRPTGELLMNRKATVTFCNSKTEWLRDHTYYADVVIVATGHPHTINKNMISDETLIIDVGINRDENGKLFGDVDRDFNDEPYIFVTPVPGGVGLMTRACLVENVIEAYKNRR